MRTPSDKELLNRAYRLATGYYLVKDFTFAQFQRIKVMNHVTEDYEYWDERSLEKEIAGMGSLIYDELARVKQEMTKE